MPGVGIEGSPVSIWKRLRLALTLLFEPDWRLIFASMGKVTAINPPDLGEGWSEAEFEAEGGIVKRQLPTIRLITIEADEVGAELEYRYYVVGADTISTLRRIPGQIA